MISLFSKWGNWGSHAVTKATEQQPEPNPAWLAHFVLLPQALTQSFAPKMEINSIVLITNQPATCSTLNHDTALLTNYVQVSVHNS